MERVNRLSESQREITQKDYKQRKRFIMNSIFGQGFDSPQLHSKHRERGAEVKTKILLNSIDNVKKFVNIATKQTFDIYLQSGRYIIDAKSIMGIFSLDLTKTIELVVENVTVEEFTNLLNEIQPFVVE